MNSLFVITITSAFVACYAIEFEIQNNLGGPALIGIQGNPGHAHLNGGGFKLNQGETRRVFASDNWAGRFWAGTWCDENNHCATGDCGNRQQCGGNGGAPPATLVEITRKGNDQRNQDFYDISLVDGFNVKASIQPIGGNGDCKRAGCDNDLNPTCPVELRVIYKGNIVGCKSNCIRYHDTSLRDTYCCSGAHNQPQTCKPNDWPTNKPNSAKYFKNRCPQAYSYAYDDRSSTFTCFNAKIYKITFG